MSGTAVAAARAAAGARGPRVRRRRRGGLAPYAAVAPALALLVGMLLYPIGYAIWLGLNETDGVSYRWVGLDNYTAIFRDETVHQVFLTNLKFLIAVPLVLLFSILCAVLIYEEVWGWKLFRVVFFIPSVLSTAVIGLMFKTFFAYDGPANKLLAGLGRAPTDWFSSGRTAFAVIVLALVWSGFGYGTLLLLAGLSSIDPAQFDAARIDGAGWWQRAWYVTVPQVRRVIAFVSIINVAYTFTSLFGFVFVMTAGGPGFETTTLDYLVYQRAFSGNQLGGGAALAVLLFLWIGVLTVVQLRVFRASDRLPDRTS